VHRDQVPARRRRHRSWHHDQALKYLRRSTSGTAGNGLSITAKYMRGAAGIDLGTTIKYLRRSKSAAVNNGLGIIGPSVFFAIFFAKKWHFFGQREVQRKNGTILGRPGIRFAAQKIITKGANISRKLVAQELSQVKLILSP
jgi:hypothetical protein